MAFQSSGSTQLRMIHRLAWDAQAVRKRLFAWAKLKDLQEIKEDIKELR